MADSAEPGADATLASCLAELELRFVVSRLGEPVGSMLGEVQAALLDARLGTDLDRARIAVALEQALDEALAEGAELAVALQAREGVIHITLASSADRPPRTLVHGHGDSFASASFASGSTDSNGSMRNRPPSPRPCWGDVGHANQAAGRGEGLAALAELACCFDLPNDPDLIAPLTRHVLRWAARLGAFDALEAARIGAALREALLNAMEHGNLEVCSRLRETGDAYHQLLAARRGEQPYSGRRVRVASRQTREWLSLVIRDEGPGFDPRGCADPTARDNLERASGRGLLLIRSFMDDVAFNATGNEITLVKHVAPRASGA